MHAELEPEKATQIPLWQFQLALAMQVMEHVDVVCLKSVQRPLFPRPMQGIAMDMDEVECVLANLIYRKLVKGYISHKTKIVVVSRTDPFPRSFPRESF